MRHAYGLVFIGLIAVVGCSSSTNTDDTSASTSDDLKAKSCKKATDCKGALPDLCRICSDGSESCAHWDCESGKCEIETCDAPPDPNACTKASDCTGPLPKICEICPDGTEQCAHHACVSGTCETQICEGHETEPPPPPGCTKASDCHGVLPDFCRICSDGSESCAHWACESGNCEITTCN